MPFFSVIIITYNRAALISRAIESLLNQVEQDWEAIIIDDGSKDNTFEIVKNFCSSEKRISYFNNRHIGISASRNHGLNLSIGKYITFLDSDDEYEQYHLASRKKILIENQEIEFLHGGVKIIGNEFVPDRNNPKQLIHLDNCIIGGTFLIKRDVFISLGGFPSLDYGGDTELYEKALQKGINISKTDIKSYIYHRDTPDSICNTIQNNEI